MFFLSFFFFFNETVVRCIYSLADALNVLKAVKMFLKFHQLSVELSKKKQKKEEKMAVPPEEGPVLVYFPIGE